MSNPEPTQISKAEKILSELKLVKTPATLEEFIFTVEGLLRHHKICGKAEYLFDENPYYENDRLGDNVIFSKEYHIDELICDDKKYEIEAEYEFYSIADSDAIHIVHMFKPMSVSEKKPE